jgi:hypothetical protein
MTKRTPIIIAATILTIILLAYLTFWTLQSICFTYRVDISSGQFHEEKSILGIVYSQKPQPSPFFDLAVKAGMDPKTLPPANWKADTTTFPFSSLHENLMYGGTRANLTILAKCWELYSTPVPQRLEQAKLALTLLQTQKRFWVNINDDTVTVTPKPHR